MLNVYVVVAISCVAVIAILAYVYVAHRRLQMISDVSMGILLCVVKYLEIEQQRLQ
jgi:hypothetical protein